MVQDVGRNVAHEIAVSDALEESTTRRTEHGIRTEVVDGNIAIDEQFRNDITNLGWLET